MHRMVDLTAASTFMATHARVLDRRRFATLVGEEPPDGVLKALAAYANADGGYGWGLEPDLRDPESQPAGALHAFEALVDVAPATSPQATAVCDWLDAVSRPDGGLPFALAGVGGPGSARWWAQADPTASSLHITSAVCAEAHAVAAHDPAVARHPWLERATAYCLRAIADRERPGSTYELLFSLGLLDVLAATRPGVRPELERLAAFVPASGELPVEGGLEDERKRPLDFSPHPGRPLRELMAADVVERDLARLEAEQADDGGWTFDWQPASAAAALEWRGALTVHAIRVLRANDRHP